MSRWTWPSENMAMGEDGQEENTVFAKEDAGNFV
jgi:hypothetical protein